MEYKKIIFFKAENVERMNNEKEQDDKDSKGGLLGNNTEDGPENNMVIQPIRNVTQVLRGLDDPKVWRWVIVAGFFVASFMQGIDKSMSIYYVEMMEYFETDSSVMSSIGSLYYAFFCFSGIITVPMTNVLGPRVIVIVGGLLLSIGLMTAAYADNVYLCIACFGFFLGSGFSMMYMNITIVIMFYFDEKRALALAIILSGYAVGGMIFPVLSQYLNEKYSWRGALVIYSSVALNVCASGALIRPIPDEKKTNNHVFRQRVESILESIKTLLTSRSVVLLWVQSTFVQGAFSIMTVHMKPTLLYKTDASDEMGSYVISFYGAAYCLGLIFAAFLSHLAHIEHIVMLETGIFLCGLSMILIPAFETVPLFITFICLFAIFSTTNSQFLPIVLCNFVGKEKLRIAWAMRYAFAGIGGLAGPAVAGYLVDTTHSYANSMLLGGSALIFSVIVMVEPCISTYRKSRVERKTTVNVEKREERWKSVNSLPGSTVGI